jgi:signal transduction histidine kinase
MSGRLSPAIEAAGYRIVQEALTNVIRHAHATRCGVTLERSDSTVRLVIDDNGIGFDSSADRDPGEPHGLGLISIRERVAQCGGTLAVESAPGRGTCIRVELPALDAPKPLDLSAAHDAAPDARGAAAIPLEAKSV